MAEKRMTVSGVARFGAGPPGTEAPPGMPRLLPAEAAPRIVFDVYDAQTVQKVLSFSSDAHGLFHFELAAGDYWIELAQPSAHMVFERHALHVKDKEQQDILLEIRLLRE